MRNPAPRIEVIGKATLYLSDCREILPALSDVDLALTDPPYGKNAAAWDTEVPVWALPLIRDSLKEGGSCYWFGEAPAVWRVGLNDALTLRRQIIWWHHTGYPSKRNYREATETILFLSKGDVRFFDADAIREKYAPRKERPLGRPDRQNPLGKSPGNVLEFPRPAPRHVDETAHPHAKPVDLLKTFVRASSPMSGLVLDPFMGSGSTGIAALGLGRTFVGIERETEYFDMACRRIEAAQADMFQDIAAQ